MNIAAASRFKRPSRRFSEVKTITSKEKDELVSKQDDHGEAKKNPWGFDGSYRLCNYLVGDGLEHEFYLTFHYHQPVTLILSYKITMG